MDQEQSLEDCKLHQKKTETMKTVFQQINLDNLLYQKRERKQITQLPVIPSSTQYLCILAYKNNAIKKKQRISGDPPKKPGRKRNPENSISTLNQLFKQDPQGEQLIMQEFGPTMDPKQNNHIQEPQNIQQVIKTNNKQINPTNPYEESYSSFEPQKKQKFKKQITFKKKHHNQLEDEELNKSNQQKGILCRLNKIFKQSYDSKQILSENENLQIKELFKHYYESIFQSIMVPEEDIQKLQDQVEQPQEVQTEELNKDQKKLYRILTEESLNLDTRRNLKLLDMEIQNYNHKTLEHLTFINCDLRYFNFDFLIEKIGHFDVILMDPPWRIKGGQQNDSQFMFTNSKFSLEYNTMSNQEIVDIKVEKLSKKGFLFMWILNTQLNIAYEMANKWGYEIVDQIIWVKLNGAGNNIYLSTGYYFMHSFEICLVGYKSPPGEHVEYHSKVSNNVLFSSVRSKSQKPNELYDIIELMMPGAKKIELFARNNNLRQGWFSLGNQLGETYQKWLVEICCNLCSASLRPGNKRFKSRKEANFDICSECFSSHSLTYQNNEIQKSVEEKLVADKSSKDLEQFEDLPTDNMSKQVFEVVQKVPDIQINEETSNEFKFQPNHFFELMNKADEEVLHQYHSCNNCDQETIWGVRFECIDCENYDLCEACFDLTLSEKKIHNIEHNFRAIEIPAFAEGIPCHDAKCNGCFQKPILGVQFVCKQCTNFSLCQNCFFGRTPQELSGPRHKQDHKLEPIYEVQNPVKKCFKCQGCELDIGNGQGVYKCENCFGFYFCEKCFVLKKDDWKCYVATSHKNYHTFMKLQ